MNISECFDFLNFWISKERGAFYTIPELELITDRGQMSLYSDLQPKYATSQRVKDALAPFRDVYNFTTLVSGYVIVPTNRNYLNLLDLQIYYTVSNRTMFYPVQIVNEDARAARLNSQIDPVTITSPIGEETAFGSFRLYPASAYNGNLTFLRRPVKPVFGYSIVSGRVIVYNSGTSTQLEWSEQWQNSVLIKALSSIGINLSDQQVSQYSELKAQQNYQSVNML